MKLLCLCLALNIYQLAQVIIGSIKKLFHARYLIQYLLADEAVCNQNVISTVESILEILLVCCFSWLNLGLISFAAGLVVGLFFISFISNWIDSHYDRHWLNKHINELESAQKEAKNK